MLAMLIFTVIFYTPCLGAASTPGARSIHRDVSAACNVQEVEVKGIVRDTVNSALSGISIVVKGRTNIGTTTDINGRFILRAPQGSILIFSSTGFASQEITVKGNDDIEVIMRQAESLLEDIVVVGFGRQKRISLTGAISDISTTELQRNSTPSLSNALGGRMPGILTRQASGEPGADQASLHIRGMASWVTNAPLVLVDGVQRDLNSINAQEIESLSVLKDASATAVYGVRGANGVIIITTKQGIVGKPTITLRSEMANMSSVRVPDYINGVEYANLINESLRNKNQQERFTEEDIIKFRDGSNPYMYPNINWWDELMEKSSLQTINNLSVRGGSDVVRYFVNVGYTMQEGIYKSDNLNDYSTNSNLQRYNFRSRVDVNLSKDFKIDLGIGGIVHQRNYPGNVTDQIFNSLKSATPIKYPIRNPDGTPGGIAPDASMQGLNPWAVMTQTGYRTSYYNTLQSTFGAHWNLSTLVTPGLSANALFSFDYSATSAASRLKNFEIKQYIGQDLSSGEDRYIVHREGTALSFSPSMGGSRAYYTEAIINYAREFGKHSVSGMMLYNQRDYVDLVTGTSTANLPFRNQGIAGRATYDYAGRYLAEVNFGYNGSENFPKGQRFGFFPSVSLGWIVSNENFWDIPALNLLKFRASHGQSGNDQSGLRFLYLTKMRLGQGNNYYYGIDNIFMRGMEEDQTGSTNVTWEVSTKTNFGIDLELLNSKLRIQADFFKESRTGILLQRRDIPVVAGFYGAIPFGNLGESKNTGLDGLIELKHNFNNGIFVSLRSNFTIAKNIILENDEPIQAYPYQSVLNHGIGQPFGLISLGFFENEEEIRSSPRQTFMSEVSPGDLKYADVNGDGVINNFDQVPIGYSRIPEIMYGFGGTIAYKGFDMSLFLTGAARTSFFLQGATMYPFQFGESNVLREWYNNHWINGADNSKALYPRVINEGNDNNHRQSTQWMRDGSYIRLKNAEIGFTAPELFNRKIGIKEVRFFINGMNLITWDKIKIVDPESNDGDGSYPIQRTFNAGIQIGI